ncbi:MAG TPA: ethanolamine ammonia-lyase reactivating factor EutA [Pirellulales bacterium]|nr:ethanolamine ammonia-lyase reactivating factor EutA [Pirellulales bacterium]
MDELWLAGFDFGSTTSRCVLARGCPRRHPVTGRMELSDLQVAYAPEPVFTPFDGDSLDAVALGALLDQWIGEWGVAPSDLAGGGAIVTGLAARAANAEVVARLVRGRFGNALVATADDPALEAWLAFMGNAARLSRAKPDRTFVNLDIGGGTTNFATGQAGQVQGAGCYYVGARHLRFLPGTYILAGASPFGARLLAQGGLARAPGEALTPSELDRVLNFYVGTLEAVVRGNGEVLAGDLAASHRQLALQVPPPAESVITLSGGVGELAYRCHRGDVLPPTTAYGDLGIDLARRIADSPLLSRDLASDVPDEQGRATVCGMAMHNTEVSGASLFLPRPDLLPLSAMPIVGRLRGNSTDDDISALLTLAGAGAHPACLTVDSLADDPAAVASFGGRLASALETRGFPPDRPLVLLAAGNSGKTLGYYATRWGRLSVPLIVLDEIAPRDARFASLGRLRGHVVAVGFHGMNLT